MKTTKFPLKFIKHWYKVVILFTVVLTQTSQAQALFRLSDWVDQNNQAEGYALGLMWQTPEELQRQVKEKKEILELLEALHVANKAGR